MKIAFVDLEKLAFDALPQRGASVNGRINAFFGAPRPKDELEFLRERLLVALILDHTPKLNASIMVEKAMKDLTRVYEDCFALGGKAAQLLANEDKGIIDSVIAKHLGPQTRIG